MVNKIDAAGDLMLAKLRHALPGAVFVSAHTGDGIDALRRRMAELAAPTDTAVDVVIPYDRGDLVARVHADGRVQQAEHNPDGTRIRARVPVALAASLREFAAQLTPGARSRPAADQPSGWYMLGGRVPGRRRSSMSSAVKYQRTLFEPEHELFRESYRAFLDRHVAPYHEEWEKAKIVDRGVWLEAGKQGFLGMAVPEEYGGGGNPDFRYNTIVTEETAAGRYSGIGFGLHNDIVAPYLLALANEEQKQRWLPKFCTGELITAIAMTEPGTGSDLQGIKTRAVKQGDHYVLNGSKTFITNGINSDLVIVVAQTDPDKGAQGFSLLVVERGMEGFERGRHLDKIGLDAQDTAELSFTDVHVPAENLLGEEGMGFIYLMQNLPQERIIIAIMAAAAMESVLDGDAAIHQGAQGFWQADRQLPKQPVRAGRAGDRGHRGAHHGRRVHRAAPGGEADGRTGRDGQVVFHRKAGAFDRPLPATARWIRLHARIPRCPRLSRRSGADDLRRHDRNHEGDHRSQPGCITAASPAGAVAVPEPLVVQRRYGFVATRT